MPWSSVGIGWSAAVWSNHSGTEENPVGPYTLALVSPAGTRYPVVTQTPFFGVLDVTADGRRILTTTGGATPTVVEWDVASHTSHVVASGASVYGEIQYTRPTGQQLLVETRPDGASDQHLVRMGRDGTIARDYGEVSSVVATADGARLVGVGATGVEVLGNATGSVLLHVPSPAGYQSCGPVSRWAGSQVALTCTQTRASDTMNDVFVLDAVSGSLRQVTHAGSNRATEMFGYGDAWPMGTRVLAQLLPGCGSGPTGLLGQGGTVGRLVSWPGLDAGSSPAILAVTPTEEYGLAVPCGSSGNGLYALNPVTGRVRTVVAAANVVSAVVIDGH